MENAKPQAQHEWLKKFIGEWTFESEADCGPDQPSTKFNGTESVKAVGELWIIGEGHGSMPGGGESTMMLTIGYDPKKQKFVGTWLGSMMTNLWVYEGTLEGNKLSLYVEGPSFTGEGTCMYCDATEFINDDERVMTSSIRGENGEWSTFMTARYRRSK